MKIAVPVQLVPDLVEELVINEQGDGLDSAYVRWILNEYDDHAIEQAILLKESYGAQITVLAPDLEGADDVLFAAAAKGADQLIKLTADFDTGFNTHALARLFHQVLQAIQPDLVLTGVQAHNALDGALGPILAELLGLPFVGAVSNVSLNGGQAVAHKEYPGGLAAEVEVTLPAVLGIQAAAQPPRYVPISKVRMAMKSASIEEQSGELDPTGGLRPQHVFLPEAAGGAVMIAGSVDEVADRIVAIFKEQGLL